MIKYKKASLFDAPEGSLIVHAVNCQGVWGSGIAKDFKERYPDAYLIYNRECEYPDCLGYADYTSAIINGQHRIGWLFTSYAYGKMVDSKNDILEQTKSAVGYLLETISTDEDYDIKTVYSNKFNSGLFNVPWEETEKVLLECLETYPDIEWIVMDPELEG